MAKALIDSSADIAITDIFNHNVFFYMVLRQKLKVGEKVPQEISYDIIKKYWKN